MCAGGGLGVKSAKPHQNLIFLESFTFQFIEAGLNRLASIFNKILAR